MEAARVRLFRCAADRVRLARRLLYGTCEAHDGDDVRSLCRELCHVARAYVKERLYGCRQHLLARCLLLGRFYGGASGRAKIRSRDAWKCLRNKDQRTASAVLELVDTDLPAHLKGVVGPILDPAERARAKSSRSTAAWNSTLHRHVTLRGPSNAVHGDGSGRWENETEFETELGPSETGRPWSTRPPSLVPPSLVPPRGLLGGPRSRASPFGWTTPPGGSLV